MGNPSNLDMRMYQHLSAEQAYVNGVIQKLK